MIVWKGGTLEEEVLVMQAVNLWIDGGEDPSDCFYEILKDLGFDSFYSDYEDALVRANPVIRYHRCASNRTGKGFG